jgi:uncharacterized protein
MLVSTAVVSTEAPGRYAKQLLAHLGHKVQLEPLDDEPEGGRLVFAYGTGTVRVSAGRLQMDAAADDEASLARLQDVLARHLERFGARRELSVQWSAAAGGADTTPA